MDRVSGTPLSEKERPEAPAGQRRLPLETRSNGLVILLARAAWLQD